MYETDVIFNPGIPRSEWDRSVWSESRRPWQSLNGIDIWRDLESLFSLWIVSSQDGGAHLI